MKKLRNVITVCSRTAVNEERLIKDLCKGLIGMLTTKQLKKLFSVCTLDPTCIDNAKFNNNFILSTFDLIHFDELVELSRREEIQYIATIEVED